MIYKLRYTFIFCLLLTPLLSQGQVSSQLGRFQVDFNEGCAPFTVNLTNNLGGTVDIIYEPGAQPLQNIFTYTYNTPGTFIIEVQYQSLLPRSDFVTITVNENIPPEFNILSCSSFQASVEIIDDNYDEYIIDFENDGSEEAIISSLEISPVYTFPGPGSYEVSVKGRNANSKDNCNELIKTVDPLNALSTSFISQLDVTGTQTIDFTYTPIPNTKLILEYAVGTSNSFSAYTTLDNSGSFSIDSSLFTTSTQFYCFRVNSFDPCNNTSNYSNTICSLQPQASLGDNRISLNWNDLNGINNYSICKDGDCSITTNTSDYDDTAVTCNQSYCYTIQANYLNGALSRSSQLCETAISTIVPPSAENITIQHVGTALEVNWQVADGFFPQSTDFIISLPSEEKEVINNLSGTSYIDSQNANISGSICYDISFTDICGNNTASSVGTCSIYLSGRVLSDNSIELNWNSYTGYQQGVSSYRIEKYDVNGNLLNSFSSAETQYTDQSNIWENQQLSYRIYAVPQEGGITESNSQLLQLTKYSDVGQPQAFTPDGDGMNDTFRLFPSFGVSYELSVFNRWGEILFKTDEPEQGWDGTFRGELLPSGTYAYKAKIIDEAGRVWNLNGFFALIRK